MLFAALAGAAAFQVGAPMLRPTPAVVSRAAPAQIAMQTGTKAEVIGAAAVGGIVGVYLFHELSTGVLLALVAAYAATTASSFGDATRSAGGAADKVYSKTLELNEQYDLLPKAKSAADAVTTAAVNIDRNYGARARRAPPLRIQRASLRALCPLRARSSLSLLRAPSAAAGISGKIDDQLKISGAIDKATGSFNDFKGSVTDKVTELKKSTESSD